MKNVFIVALSVFLGLAIVVIVGSGAVALAAPQSIIHVLGGKTGIEYNDIVTTLNQTKDSLNQTKDSLSQTQDSLAQAQGDLEKAKSDLGTANGQISTLQDKVNSLTASLDKWKGLLCQHSWAEATNKNMAFPADNKDGSLRKLFNALGFDLLITQWKYSLDTNQPYDVLIQDLKGEIILDVTKHCLIFSAAKMPTF